MAATAVWKGALDRPAPAELVRADWAQRNAELERTLLDGLPRDYLRHPSVAFQMFVGEHHARRELPYVIERLGGDLSLLVEPPQAGPVDARAALLRALSAGPRDRSLLGRGSLLV